MGKKQNHAASYRVIPELLKEARISAGFTQRELGILMKKTQNFVFQSENFSRRVDAAEMAIWFRACGINVLDGFQKFIKMANLDRLPVKRDRLTDDEVKAIKASAKVRRLRSIPKKGE